MLKTLVWKESREVLPLVALALVGQLLLFLSTRITLFGTYNESGTIPFLTSDWVPTWILIAGGLTAVVLGYWQTSGELLRGTFLYLLHRPIDRRTAFVVKLLLGITLVLLVSGLPLLIYSLWAASPGTHASPFFWSMTVGSWQFWSHLPLFYLGAFLSGLRPGRWLGSRGLPLAAGLLAYLSVFLFGFWPWVTLLSGLLLEGWFVFTILFVAETRDFS